MNRDIQMHTYLNMRVPGDHKIYPPVEQCIYCGSKDGLSDEHIIPYGINGSIILSESSCESCSKITKIFEQRLLKGMFAPIRYKAKLRTRRPKERPKSIKTISKCQDGSIKHLEIPTEKFPGILFGLRLPPPGILEPCNNPKIEILLKCDEDLKPLLLNGEKIKLFTVFSTDFYQLLAKIAHGFAVAELGIDGFHPMLTDLILGLSNNFLYFIGGDGGMQNDDFEKGRIIHQRALREAYKDGVWYVVVCVKLFTFDYNIIAGRKL